MGAATLASDVGVHRATVFRAVEAAIRRGWIAPNPSHGGRLPQNFVLTFPADKPSQPCDGSEHPTVAPQRLLETPTVAAVQRNRRTSATQPSQGQWASREKPKASTRLGHLVGQRERAVESDSSPPVCFAEKKRSPTKRIRGQAAIWYLHSRRREKNRRLLARVSASRCRGTGAQDVREGDLGH
jgi:hypothetical protein